MKKEKSLYSHTRIRVVQGEWKLLNMNTSHCHCVSKDRNSEVVSYIPEAELWLPADRNRAKSCFK